MKELSSGDKFNGVEQKYFEWSNQTPPPKVWTEIEAPALTAAIKEEVGNKISDLKVLDIGVGGGKVLGLLQELGVKKENITGVDINSKMLSLVQDKYPNIKLMIGDISNENILKNFCNEEQFDLITASMIFNHLDDDQLKIAISNAFKLLKDGGILITLVPYPNRWDKMNTLKDTKTGYKCTEISPWGGKTTYHHRDMAQYGDYFDLSGFMEKAVVAEYEIPGREITKMPNRLLVIGKKSQDFRDFQISNGIGVEEIDKRYYFPGSRRMRKSKAKILGIEMIGEF